jgi:cytosine deaminase
MHDPLASLAGEDVVLAQASVPACLVPAMPAAADGNGLVLVDIALAGGRVASVEPHDPAAAGPGRVDLGRRMVWPCPVDVHTHLDKGHIWPRSPNPDGSFMGALLTVQADREQRWAAHDVRARFEFGLRCAYAHGTCAIRTHLDSIPPQDAISWPVFAELRAAWAGRIELQAVSLAMQEHYRGEAGKELARTVAEHGGVLGLVPQMAPELDDDLDRFFALANEHGLDVDCHIDETLDPGSQTLRHLAEAALRNRYRGRIAAGHCCSLSRQAPDDVRRTLDLVAQARIAIVSLPLCNLYLQDRVGGRTPRWRGVTLAHEIRARGIPIAFASDNCRDPFYAYGDHDLHEVFREAVRIAHLDHPIGDWPATVTTTPAAIMGLEGKGRIAAGGPADLVIFEGRFWHEVLPRPEAGRVVLRAGSAIDVKLPAYTELDGIVSA